MIETRRLTSVEIQSLGRLFEEQKREVGKVDFWQERKDFLKMYEPSIAGEAIYWGAFIQGQLVATTGAVPIRVNQPWAKITYLDTDFFVDPNFRRSFAAGHLVEARFQDHRSFPCPRNLFYFGVEQEPGLLKVCTRIVRKYGGTFDFPLRTTLHQVFLTSPPAQLHQSEIKFVPLAEASVGLKQQWIDIYSSKNKLNIFSPLISISTLDKILLLDPKCALIFHEDFKAGAIAFSQTHARKFRMTGRPTLTMARLARVRPGEVGQGLELKIIMATLCFGESDASFALVLSRLQEWAWNMGFHCLSLRDIPRDYKLPSDTESFERRIFFTFGDEEEFAKDLKEFWSNPLASIKLDSAFL